MKFISQNQKAKKMNIAHTDISTNTLKPVPVFLSSPRKFQLSVLKAWAHWNVSHDA